MDEPDGHDWRDRTRAFVVGTYPGAPIAYVMAIAIVMAMIAVVVLQILSGAWVANAVVWLVTPIDLLFRALLLR